jgi:ABC-2 type transport system ATP-binding protein
LARDVIVTENLTKHYGNIVGVESLDLRVSEGEIFGFLGPNGAGKTTTMRLLMGLLAPTAGSASILDLDCWKRSVEVKRVVGYLPGEPAMYKRLTGERLIRFVAGFGADEKAGFDFAERLELDVTRQLKEYSRGMKQKMALTLALMRRAPLVIMDEPTNGLDPLTQYVLYEILQEQREAGVTILFSSHNLPEVERISDRVGIIKDGRMATIQKIDELRNMKLRNVDITFKGQPPEGLDRLPGISGFEIAGDRVQLKLRGDINPLLKAIAGVEVADLAIAHASLEDVFLEYYSLPGEEHGGAVPGAGGAGEGGPAEGGRP